ncbi:MAG TPA: hypothetical protein VJ697_10650 [Nitrososphaeraceae archaeon]|nr:hypothetical protein [Nitrososphaeraceae archaeon]
MSRINLSNKIKRRKISNRNKTRLYYESHTKTRKNKWFQENRKLLKEIDMKDEKIELLKR